jgi:hypothetical protein
MATHPRTRARGTQRVLASDARLRVLVYAPKPASSAWIERELGQEPVIIQRARSVEETVSSLVDVPPPRPQILIADLDSMTAGELLHLHSIRDQGWFGSVIALGSVPITLRLSLRIERVIDAPYPRDALRGIVSQSSPFHASTIRMPKISG